MRGIKFIKEREDAVKLRKRGLSIGYIESKIGISRSTISSWLKRVELTKSQKNRLRNQWQLGMIKARKKAVLWHNFQKAKRLERAEREAEAVLKNLNLNNKNILDLALSMLYLGEGFKKSLNVGMGNADPNVLRFLIHVLKNNYQISKNALTAQLHLRADQNEQKEIRYWAKILNISEKNFKWTQFDRRTANRKTYSYYHGVCAIYCYDVAIQRKLLSISKQFINTVTTVARP